MGDGLGTVCRPQLLMQEEDAKGPLTLTKSNSDRNIKL